MLGAEVGIFFRFGLRDDFVCICVYVCVCVCLCVCVCVCVCVCECGEGLIGLASTPVAGTVNSLSSYGLRPNRSSGFASNINTYLKG